LLAKIKLGNSTICALVDDDLVKVLEFFSWHKTAHGYAAGSNANKKMMMHRFVMGVKDPKVMVDHINGNKLDNRRENLRIATASQNGQNTRKAPSTAGFIGVSYDGIYIKAGIKIGGKRVHLGMFENPIEAAIVYDNAARKAFGPDARTNLTHFKELVEKLTRGIDE
jgi:hypothetical protein